MGEHDIDHVMESIDVQDRESNGTIGFLSNLDIGTFLVGVASDDVVGINYSGEPSEQTQKNVDKGVGAAKTPFDDHRDRRDYY